MPTPVIPGETKETLNVGEVQRQAVVYIPAKLAAARVPAIIYLTATGMDRRPLRLRYGIGFDIEADRLGFVAVWAEGSVAAAQGVINTANGVTCCYWDNGSTTWDNQRVPDDIAFFKALLDLLVAKYPVDPDRISFAGAAGGAVMTYRLACELSDRIAAFADVSSSHRDNTGCPTARPVSMMLVLGTANAGVPVGGGASPNRATGPPIPAVNDVIEYWRRLDGCIGDPAVTMITAKAEQRRYATCKASEVVLITVTDGENGWWGASYFGAIGDPALKATPIVAEFLIKQSRAGR
jgi:polyhydroxybutyrate depolymerase